MEEEKVKDSIEPIYITFKIEGTTDRNKSAFNTLVLDLQYLKDNIKGRTFYGDDERNIIIEKMKMQLDYLKTVKLGE